MSEKLFRKSLELTPDQWRRLDELAALLQSIARGGPGHNKPSWRILIRQIADSQLTIKETEK